MVYQGLQGLSRFAKVYHGSKGLIRFIKVIYH